MLKQKSGYSRFISLLISQCCRRVRLFFVISMDRSSWKRKRMLRDQMKKLRVCRAPKITVRDVLSDLNREPAS